MYPGRHNQAPPGQLGGGRPAPPGQGAIGLGQAPPGQGALGLGQAPPGQGGLGLGQAPPGPIGGILGHGLPTFGGQGDGSYGVMPDWSGGIRGPTHGGMHGQGPLPGLLGALGGLGHALGPMVPPPVQQQQQQPQQPPQQQQQPQPPLGADSQVVVGGAGAMAPLSASNTPPSQIVSPLNLSPPGLPSPDGPVFNCPRRPNLGREGKPILLRANHFQINMPRGYINHYTISIQPDKCPRRVNRDIIQTMVHAYGKIFGSQKPVFDGRSNLYVRDPLPIGKDAVELEVTLDGEGKDRVFRVSIKWHAQVSLFALE